jgi:hypothetical protein
MASCPDILLECVRLPRLDHLRRINTSRGQDGLSVRRHSASDRCEREHGVLEVASAVVSMLLMWWDVPAGRLRPR